MKDYYRILSIPENATEADIKRAYRRLAKRYHPDVNAGAKGAEERFKEIVEAYEVLIDPVLKRAYDLKRLRGDLYFNGNLYRKESSPPPEKKDPRRKEYSEEDLERARTRYRTRLYRQMQRRRKLLFGMIISFTLFLVGAALFEYWIDQQRQKQNEMMRAEFAQRQKKSAAIDTIQNLDSPYDSLFGPARTMWLSPNEIVVYNPVSEAVICLVQCDTPYCTVRNEFSYAKTAFTMKDLPNGSFWFKVYTGSHWDRNKRIPGGRGMGGFTKDEEFFRIKAGPFTLEKPTPGHVDTNTSDTIVIDPTVFQFEPISRAEFFATGDLR